MTGQGLPSLAMLASACACALLLAIAWCPETCDAYYLPALTRPGSIGVRGIGESLRPPAIARRAEPHGDGFVRMPMTRKTFKDLKDPKRTPERRRYRHGHRDERDHRDLDRRWGWSNLTDFQGLAYLIDLKIGNPPQKVFVNVDTGSYELWVSPNCSNSDDAPLCRRNGLYYPERSSSAVRVGGTRHLVYGTGEALGTYWADTMKAAMMQIPEVQFMVASDSVYAYAGVLGLGYTYPWTTPYPYTMMQMMWAYGLIKAPIFSLGLGGEGEGDSEIIFGGVNVWKYTGRFEPIPIWPPIDQQDPSWLQYWVNVTSIGMTKPGENRTATYTRPSFSMPMLIDSGSTLSYMREDIVATIAAQFNARVDAGGTYWVDCAYRDMKGWVEFGFNHGNMVISVRYKDFIWKQYPGGCLLGVQPADHDSVDYVLGDTFLRAAYMVFDQQSDVVWLSRWYNCGDGVVVVGEKSADTQWALGEC